MTTYILVANADEARQIQPLDTVQILITGEGRSNVIKNLSRFLKEGTITAEDKIINIGYVGANGYKKGEVVQIGQVSHLSPSTYVSEPPIPLNLGDSETQVVNCCTADNFVHQGDVSADNRCVVDMELYYIALMFPTVMAFKVVSDELNYDDYHTARFDESWQKVRNLIQKILL